MINDVFATPLIPWNLHCDIVYESVTKASRLFWILEKLKNTTQYIPTKEKLINLFIIFKQRKEDKYDRDNTNQLLGSEAMQLIKKKIQLLRLEIRTLMRMKTEKIHSWMVANDFRKCQGRISNGKWNQGVRLIKRSWSKERQLEKMNKSHAYL